MFVRLSNLVNRITAIAAGLSMILLVCLIGVMVYEVFCRYVLSAPTIWAFDIAFMTNGTLFVLAAGYTLSHQSHIRIDFVSAMLPTRIQHTVNFVFFLFLFLPIIVSLFYIASEQAFHAFNTGRRELTSAWGPRVWPYYTTLAMGLLVLCLQVLGDIVRYLIGVWDPSRVSLPGTSEAPSA